MLYYLELCETDFKKKDYNLAGKDLEEYTYWRN